MKKITSLILTFLMVISSVVAFAEPFDLHNVKDVSKNYSWDQFLDDTDVFDYIADNLEDYLIEAENGEKYWASEVNAATQDGTPFVEAIKELEPYKPEEDDDFKVIEISAITTKIENKPKQQLEYKLYGENGKEITELPEGYSVKFLYTIDNVADDSDEAKKGIVDGSANNWSDGFEYQVVVTPEEGDPIKSDWTKVEVADPEKVVEVTAVGIFDGDEEVPAVNLGDKGLVFKATKGINAFGDEVEDLDSVEVKSAKSSDSTIAYYVKEDNNEGLVVRKEGTVTFEIKFKDIEKTFELDVEIKAGQKLTSVVAEDQKVTTGSQVELEAELLDQFDNPMKDAITDGDVVVKILDADEEEVANNLNVTTAGKLGIEVAFAEEGTYTVNIYAKDGKTLLGTFSVEAVKVANEEADDYDLVLANEEDEAVLDINEDANANKLELIIKGYVKGVEVQSDQFSDKLAVKTSNEVVATVKIDENDQSKVTVTLEDKAKVGTITVTLFIKEGAKETSVATIDVEVVNTTPQILDLVLKEGVIAVEFEKDADEDTIKAAVVEAVEATFNEGAPEDTKFNDKMFNIEYVKANAEVIVTINDVNGGKEFKFDVKIVEEETQELGDGDGGGTGGEGGGTGD